MPVDPFVIAVLAGVNGAGKSSVGGAHLLSTGACSTTPTWWPARFARLRLPSTPQRANAYAWHRGKELLEAAIANRTDFNFETTLGGETVTKLLIEAARQGATLNLWYAGLSNVDLHIKRVASQVKKGGHPIPEADIRKRWIGSHVNLVGLLPHLTNLRVYDNSTERDPDKGQVPEPTSSPSRAGRLSFPDPTR